MRNTLPVFATDFLPLNESATFNPDASLMQITSNNIGYNTYLGTVFEQVAACLSTIELELDCYKLSHIRFSTHILRGLLLIMNMPAVGRLATKMEEQAKDNKFSDAKKLLWYIKKNIAHFVQHHYN